MSESFVWSKGSDLNRQAQHGFAHGRTRAVSRAPDTPAGDVLLSIVDYCLVGIICISPFFFGGRHDLGRLVFVALVALGSTAWFVRQAMRPDASWKDTAAFGIAFLVIALLIVQITPLPSAWLDRIATRNTALLPLWQPTGAGTTALGLWRTVSLTQHETTKSLAMALGYALLLVVVVQRIEDISDIRRILRWIAISAVLMATFGLAQYFTSNGKFFWFFEHPYRSTNDFVCGSFMNRNHFADFLVLGFGPLASWLLESLQNRPHVGAHQVHFPKKLTVTAFLLAAAMAVVVFAILLSLSRGGTLALLTAVAVIALIYARSRLVTGKYLAVALGVVVVLMGLLSVYGYDQVRLRLSSLTKGSMNAVDHNEGRRKIWGANIAAFEQGGLLGAGAGSHRLIYPVYLRDTLLGEYTHAESGYLQIATETGEVGVTLLIIAVGLTFFWCVSSVRHARSEIEQLCCGAICCSLAANAIHSIVDFVWYIPACMSITVVLAGCAARLAQITAGESTRTLKSGYRMLRFGRTTRRWLAAASVAASSGWMVFTFYGPAGAAIHWDRFLRVSVAHGKLSNQTLANLITDRETASRFDRDAAAMVDAMVRHLKRTIAWDPAFAPARLKLAAYQMIRFEQTQREANNAMEVSQIRDASLASHFQSSSEIRSWLNRAFGGNAALLESALQNTRAGLEQSPLEGSGYLYLAQLCFIEGADRRQVDAYLDQGLRVRPHDGNLLFEVGKQSLVDGDSERAMRLWRECYQDPGPNQLKIIYLLAGKYPATVFVDLFQPKWPLLLQIWARYLEKSHPEDLEALLAYSAEVSEQQVREKSDTTPDRIWYWQARMYQDAGRSAAALDCLQRAYRCNPRAFDVRLALGYALMEVDRCAEAEPHFRWCMARQPENSHLRVALAKISEARRADDNASSRNDASAVSVWSR